MFEAVMDSSLFAFAEWSMTQIQIDQT